ncbi:hypothetical protein PG985_002321 [Apiospora marii]|uniref:Uncharacterized protein n=1 Tax=Apiospora marii TaxID=335849 RepID=A0ABR1RSJ3_9PEZI
MSMAFATGMQLIETERQKDHQPIQAAITLQPICLRAGCANPGNGQPVLCVDERPPTGKEGRMLAQALAAPFAVCKTTCSSGRFSISHTDTLPSIRPWGLRQPSLEAFGYIFGASQPMAFPLSRPFLLCGYMKSASRPARALSRLSLPNYLPLWASAAAIQLVFF